MDDDKEIHGRDSRRVRDSSDTLKLKELMRKLQAGDALYCHDGSLSNVSTLKEAIKARHLPGFNPNLLLFPRIARMKVEERERLVTKSTSIRLDATGCQYSGVNNSGIKISA
jgi:hypothetical protein